MDRNRGKTVVEKQRPLSPNIYVTGPDESTRSLPIFTRVDGSAEICRFFVGKMPDLLPLMRPSRNGQEVGKPTVQGKKLWNIPLYRGGCLVLLGTSMPARGALPCWKSDPLGGYVPPMGPGWVVLAVSNGTLNRGATPSTERSAVRFAPAMPVQGNDVNRSILGVPL